MPSEDEEIYPANIVRLEVSGGHYGNLVEQAQAQFDRFFKDCPWKFLGAKIEPQTWSNSFEDSGDVLVWKGEFYAVAIDSD